MKFILKFIILFVISSSCMASPVTFVTKKITVGGKKLTVEVADSDTKRAKGLMYRDKPLKKNNGMLFVFDQQGILRFWMKNTFIPLSIGFFDENKKLIDIQKMTPVKTVMQQDIPQYESSGKAKYALEVNQGWFEKNKVKRGAKLLYAQ